MSEQPTYDPGVLAAANALYDFRRDGHRPVSSTAEIARLIPEAQFIVSRVASTIAAKAREIERGWWEERYPCDGLCTDAPEEDCSRHGMKVVVIEAGCAECGVEPGEPLIERIAFESVEEAKAHYAGRGWAMGHIWAPHPQGGEHIVTGQGSVWITAREAPDAGAPRP